MCHRKIGSFLTPRFTKIKPIILRLFSNIVYYPAHGTVWLSAVRWPPYEWRRWVKTHILISTFVGQSSSSFESVFLLSITHLLNTIRDTPKMFCCFWSNTLEFTPTVCSWSITDTDSVLCASEDCVILQSIWNTSIVPTWQFRL